MSKNILVVAPHADDEILGCGGSMSKHIQNGDNVYVVILTKGIEDLFDEDYMKTVRSEAVASHNFIGITKTFFLDFPAPKLDVTASYEIADELSKLIKKLGPATLYIPHRGDIHKDHQVAFESALVAARPVNSNPVKNILAYETLSETEWAAPFADAAFIPNVFINIEEHLMNKIEAFKCYESQMKQFPNSRSIDALTALARYRGAIVGCKAAEAFIKIREIID